MYRNACAALPCLSALACRRWRRACGALAVGLCIPYGQAQECAVGACGPGQSAAGEAAAAPAGDWRPPLRQAGGLPDDPRDVDRRTLAIIAASSLGVAVYGQRNWWNEGFTGRFRSVNEGWFGQNTYSGGADKLGHFYMNYASVRLFARAFEWAGNDPDRSRQLAAWLTFGMFTAVEVLDGFSKQWRFSREDVVMNTAGIGAALLLERHPELDRVLDLRFLYRPSHEDGEGFDPIGDYSGQTYLAVFKAGGIPALRRHPVLRYVELSVGYGTRHYGSGTGYGTRNVVAGVSLNLSEVLNATVFAGARRGGRAQRLTDTALEFVQVPGTGAFAKHRLRPD